MPSNYIPCSFAGSRSRDSELANRGAPATIPLSRCQSSPRVTDQTGSLIKRVTCLGRVKLHNNSHQLANHIQSFQMRSLLWELCQPLQSEAQPVHVDGAVSAALRHPLSPGTPAQDLYPHTFLGNTLETSGQNTTGICLKKDSKNRGTRERQKETLGREE